MSVQILIGDSLEILRTLPSDSVHCCVTSPSYYQLRDYGIEGQIGLEETPEQYITALVEVFDEVRRVLRPDGTCWVNMGDKFMDKQLLGTPWRLALGMQDAGWCLRQDIIWSKPNPMPESVRDRCTKSHEYIFLFTKTDKYFFNQKAVAEPVTASTVARLSQYLEGQRGSDRVPGKTNGTMKAVGTGVGFERGYDATAKPRAKRDSFKREGSKRAAVMLNQSMATHRPDRAESAYDVSTRNKRSVWTMATHPFSEAHFATFPPELPETCIKAGCPPGGTVLDPFFGAGTTGLVADRMNRDCIGIELNPAYAEIARKRIQSESTLFADVQVAA